MKKNSKKESAVSPVIGTILLVAITVVLVTIISAVVMGMTGNVGQTYTVGLKVGSNSSDHTVTVIFTGGDYAKITSLNATTDGGTPAEFSGVTGSQTIGTTYKSGAVATAAGTKTVSLIAKFDTGSEQIIWTGPLAL